MRYDPQRKIQRNQDLMEYRDKHPHDSWREIGERYNVCGGRARAIYLATVANDKLRRGQ